MTKRKTSVNNEDSDLLLRRMRKKYWWFIVSIFVWVFIVFPVFGPNNNELGWLWLFASVLILGILSSVLLRCPFCKKHILAVPLKSPPGRKIHLSIISPNKCNNCLRDLRVKVTTQVPSERAEPLGNERLIIGGQASAVKYHCQSLPSSHSLFLLGRDI